MSNVTQIDSSVFIYKTLILTLFLSTNFNDVFVIIFNND